MLAQKSACENVRRERRSMSKNELRSSGERRRRGIANGAGELPSPFHKCRAGGFPAVSGTASAHVHMLCLTFIIGIVAAFYRFAVDLRHPVRISVCVSCAALLLLFKILTAGFITAAGLCAAYHNVVSAAAVSVMKAAGFHTTL